MNKQKEILLYIAGPYNGDTENNIKRAEIVSIGLINKGFGVITPHKNFSGYEKYEDNVNKGNNQGYQISGLRWLELDLDILSRCDAVYIMVNSENSKGVKEEIEFAKNNNMMIIYEEEYSYKLFTLDMYNVLYDTFCRKKTYVIRWDYEVFKSKIGSNDVFGCKTLITKEFNHIDINKRGIEIMCPIGNFMTIKGNSSENKNAECYKVVLSLKKDGIEINNNCIINILLYKGTSKPFTLWKGNYGKLSKGIYFDDNIIMYENDYICICFEKDDEFMCFYINNDIDIRMLADLWVYRKGLICTT